MRKLPWMLVVLLIVLSGCAAPKNIDRDTQIDYYDDLQLAQNRMDSLLYNMQLMCRETSERLSNLKIENTTTYLSMPDSTGKQYPTAVSNTTANKEEKENKSTDTKMEAAMQILIAEVNELKQQLNATISDKEKIVEVSWWQLHKVDIYMVILALAVVGWLVYRWRMK